MDSKEIKFLLTHSSIYGLGTVISRLVAFLLLPLYTRYLTPTDYGVLETIDITSALIGIVITIGIARSLSRFYYESKVKEERNKVVSTTYILYIIVAILSLPLLYFGSSILSSLLLGSPEYTYYFRVSFVALVLGGLVDIGIMYLRVIKKPVIFVSVTVTRLILLIFFNIIFIVHFKLGILGILYSSLIVKAGFAVLLSGAILFKSNIRFSLKLSVDMLKYSLPIIPSSLASTLVKQSDKYFVLHFITLADMGIYSLALKLGNSVHNLITMPFNTVYIPRRFEIMNDKNASKTYAQVFTYYIFLMVFIGFIISVYIPEILRFMVSPKFYGAAKYIPLVVFSMIVFGSQYHFDFGILFSKKTKYLAYINFISALLNLLLNFILIKNFGLWGAIWSSVITLSIQSFLLYYVSNKIYKIDYEFMRILKYLSVVFILYLISTRINFDSLLLNNIGKTMIVALFPFILKWLKVVSNEEISQIKRFYNNKIKSFRLRIKPSVSSDRLRKL